MANLPTSCEWRTISISERRPTAKWITARVLAMMSHFYQPEISPEIEELAMTDWISLLGDIPQAAIEQAVAERLRSDNRGRPLPGEIRQRALAWVEKPPKTDEESPFRPVVVAPEELARRREMSDRVAKEFPALRQITKCPGDSK